MPTEISVALITGAFSLLVGSLTVICVWLQNKKHNAEVSALIEYRISQLEEKQDKHNQLIDRMYHAEKAIEVLDERQRTANHRIDDLERGTNYGKRETS